jgi:hypothetical protein
VAQIIFATSARALEGLLTIDASQKSSCSFHWKYLAGLRNLDEAAAAAAGLAAWASAAASASTVGVVARPAIIRRP